MGGVQHVVHVHVGLVTRAQNQVVLELVEQLHTHFGPNLHLFPLAPTVLLRHVAVRQALGQRVELAHLTRAGI